MDADVTQESLTHYLENRAAWARLRGIDLPIPAYERLASVTSEDADAFVSSRIDDLSAQYEAIVIDTPGHENALTRSIHARADVLVTPLNDSFVDLDVLARLHPETLAVVEVGTYAKMIQKLRENRRTAGQPDINWIVVRNRLSVNNTHNKRNMGQALLELSCTLGFRCAEGLAERLVFREFFPKGLTAIDDLSERALGVRPTMSHATAQLEVQSLLQQILGKPKSEVGLDDRRLTAA
jgi:chromosome partitioning protein